jgi:hypothetical protein
MGEGWRPVKKWKTHKPAEGAVPYSGAELAWVPEEPSPIYDDEGARIATDRYAKLAGD